MLNLRGSKALNSKMLVLWLLLLSSSSATRVSPKTRCLDALASGGYRCVDHRRRRLTPVHNSALKKKDLVWAVKNMSSCPKTAFQGQMLKRLSNRGVERVLTKKWIVLIGDSSLRMLADSLTGRLETWPEEWPRKWNNHGPPHPTPCIATPCWFDAFIRGIRITFAWDQWLNTSETLDWFTDLTNRTTGVPDVVLVDSGPWQIHKHVHWDALPVLSQFITKLDTIIKDAGFSLKNEWPDPWRRPPWKIWSTIPVCGDKAVPPVPGSEYAKALAWNHRVRSHFRTTFPDWAIFDRTKPTEFPAMLPAVRHSGCARLYDTACHLGKFHPTGPLLTTLTDILPTALSAT